MSDTASMGDFKTEIKKLVAEIAERPVEEIRDDAKFAEDLGIDSMMALEIIASIEKKYKVVIPEAEIPNIRSLQNVFDLVEKLFKK
ncbi:MAG: acyl carrier protein [Candidatus Omnitrophota bacterium]|nr:acyl carrier protein [Candidatus Omnitrophota bacterium]